MNSKMKQINVLYDDDFEDVDILLVPDDIALHIDDVTQQFIKWLNIPENRCRFLILNGSGNQVLGVDTEEFLWWLNHIKILDEQKASIVCQHTKYINTLPTAEF